MEVSLEEAVVIELMRVLKSRKGKVDKLALEKLVFLVAHGEFDSYGRIVGLRVVPRLGVDYRVYFRGVHSRDLHEIIERLMERGLIVVRDNDIDLAHREPIKLPEDIAFIVRSVAKYAELSPRQLEELTNRLLGIEDETTKALVFNARIVNLLKAKEEARKLREKGLLVDV